MLSQLCARLYFLFREPERCRRMPSLIKSTYKTYSVSLNRKKTQYWPSTINPFPHMFLAIMATPFRMSVLIKINAFELLYFIHIVRIHDEWTKKAVLSYILKLKRKKEIVTSCKIKAKEKTSTLVSYSSFLKTSGATYRPKQKAKRKGL